MLTHCFENVEGCVKKVQTVITRYTEKEIIEAVQELEKRGFVRKSEIVRVAKNGKAFKKEWKVPEFVENYQNVKYMCRLELLDRSSRGKADDRRK